MSGVDVYLTCQNMYISRHWISLGVYNARHVGKILHNRGIHYAVGVLWWMFSYLYQSHGIEYDQHCSSDIVTNWTLCYSFGEFNAESRVSIQRLRSIIKAHIGWIRAHILENVESWIFGIFCLIIILFKYMYNVIVILSISTYLRFMKIIFLVFIYYILQTIIKNNYWYLYILQVVVHVYLPSILYATIALVSAVLILWLPETRGKNLVQTLDEGETFTKINRLKLW